MSAWAISEIVLWVVVLFLCVAVLELYRQMGVLHLRFGPRGALSFKGEGPAVGEHFPAHSLISVAGQRMSLPTAQTPTLLIFVSPTCGICKMLIPAMRAIARTYPDTVAVLVIGDDADAS